eukprot:3147100-Pleurochrysis_carterae.AAC.1
MYAEGLLRGFQVEIGCRAPTAFLGCTTEIPNTQELSTRSSCGKTVSANARQNIVASGAYEGKAAHS